MLDRYWTLDEIYDYMAQVATEFPNLAQFQQVGQTAEGREIRGIYITDQAHLEREALPVILITAGVNGRDWISTMAAVEIIHELTEHYEDFSHLIDNIEWIILPVINPDGFEFTRTPGVSFR